MFIRKGGGRKFFISKGGGRWRRQSSWKGLHPASTYQTGRRKGRKKGRKKEEHILVAVIMRYHMQYVNLSILSTSTET